MCTEQDSGKTESLLRGLRIEPVDNWHGQWGNVLAEIESAGQRQALSIDMDGWLSARQVLLVAFNESQVAGHICFGITPVSGEGGQVTVQAHLDAFGVKPGFESLEIGPALKQAAQRRAEALKCSQFVGF